MDDLTDTVYRLTRTTDPAPAPADDLPPLTDRVYAVDELVKVDVYIPGCPPRPEGLIYGMMKLQQLIVERRGRWAERAVGPTVPAGV